MEQLDNPVIKDDSAMEAQLAQLAHDYDAGGQRPNDESALESAPPESVPRTAEDPETPEKTVTDNAESSPEEQTPETPRDELGRFTKADGTKSEPNEPTEAVAEVKDPTPYAKAKDDARLAKSWQKLEAEKQQVRAEAEALRKEREEQILKPRDEKVPATGWEFTSEAYKNTAQDLERQAAAHASAGNHEESAADYGVALKAYKTAEKAAEAEQKDQAQRQQKQFEALWNRNMQETMKEVPETAQEGSVLSEKIKELFRTDPVFNFIPDGFKKATEIAKLMLKTGKDSALEAKTANQIKELTAKVAKYEKLLAIEGSGPVQRVTPRGFDQLSLEEQEKALDQMAQSAGMINF